MSPVSSHQLFCPDTRTTHWTGWLLGFQWRRFDPHRRLGHGKGHFLALVSTLVMIWASFLRCNFSSSNLPNIQGRSCGILCVYASYSSNGMFIHARARTSLLHCPAERTSFGGFAMCIPHVSCHHSIYDKYRGRHVLSTSASMILRTYPDVHLGVCLHNAK